jgi:asparagine synthase (glutamine-hydrolysing)
MGGIAGIFHLQTAKPVDAARVRAMTNVLAHRGPDGSGVWTAPGIGLGHCRLAIIDLAGGGQPMATEDGGVVTILDGEIYNFNEVRSDLERLGHVFRTASDTEIVLHGWRQWGPASLSRFHGMFAFALYDAGAGTLFLARDRLGAKPLYYAELSDGALIFASELKGLLAHPLLRRSPDPTAIDDYLGLGYVPDDACMVAGVRKLPAGHHLTLRRGMNLPRPIQWWDMSFADRASGRAAALEDQLVGHMRDAVRSCMIGDVPLGAFLSGGVDSSAIVALMAEASREAVQTCSIGFDESDQDETRHAGIVAKRFATAHRTRTVAADDFGLIDRLVAAFDEPFADASTLSTYRLCELGREKATVVLSGDGADEAFAGHRRHGLHAGQERIRRLLPSGLRTGLFARSGEEVYADAVAVTGQVARHQLYSAEAKRLLGRHRAEDRYVKAMRDAPARDPLDRAQYADLKIRLPGDILTRVDRMSMAVGLEVREPMLDHRLVEFAASLPVTMRMRRGTGKWLMKRAMRRYLPDEILNRPETDFIPPLSDWFRGPLATQANAIAHGSALADTGWFDSMALERIAAEHRSGRFDHGRLLWQLMMLDRSLARLFGLGPAQPYLASTK